MFFTTIKIGFLYMILHIHTHLERNPNGPITEKIAFIPESVFEEGESNNYPQSPRSLFLLASTKYPYNSMK